jgi:hypothetical protein
VIVVRLVPQGKDVERQRILTTLKSAGGLSEAAAGYQLYDAVAKLKRIQGSPE